MRAWRAPAAAAAAAGGGGGGVEALCAGWRPFQRGTGTGTGTLPLTSLLLSSLPIHCMPCLRSSILGGAGVSPPLRALGVDRDAGMSKVT